MSSYGIVNHFNISLNKIENYIASKKIKNLADKINHYKYFEYNSVRFKNFIEKIDKLSKLKNFNFLIRPHPSENINFYKTYLKKKKNFKYSNKFSIVEWIKASELVIHDYCTTSFEANLLGKKTLYFPVNSSCKIINKDIYKISSPLLNNKKLNKNIIFKKKKIINNYIYNSGNLSCIDKIIPIFKKFLIDNIDHNNLSKDLKLKAILGYYSLRENKYTNFKTEFVRVNECKKKLKIIHKIEKINKINNIKQFSKNIVLIKP